jgi:hypothetical protein
MIFIKNKYTNWYYQIINRAQNRILVAEYFEKHHIIPKSLGGSNNKINLVKLTAREHFVCHWLLTKMVDGEYRKKMCYALHAMGNLLSENRYINSRAFEKIKIECAQLRSIAMKGTLTGEKNYNYGKKWSEEQRKKMSEFRTGKNFNKEYKPISNETREKMKYSSNQRWTIEERAKFSAKKKADMFIYICPNCGKQGKGKTNLIRWHGDNCNVLLAINNKSKE